MRHRGFRILRIGWREKKVGKISDRKMGERKIRREIGLLNEEEERDWSRAVHFYFSRASSLDLHDVPQR